MDYDRKFQDGLVNQGEPAELVAEYFLRASGLYGPYEVKCDLQAWDTGRVFVEKTSRDSLSGLSTTKADWWITILPEVKDKNYDTYTFNPDDVQTALITRTDTLRQFVANNYFPLIRGGDSDTSEGWLIPIHFFPTNQNSMFPERMHCPGCECS